MLRVVPANQRFDSSDASGVRRDQGLVVQDKLLTPASSKQILFQQEPALGSRAEFRRDELVLAVA